MAIEIDVEEAAARLEELYDAVVAGAEVTVTEGGIAKVRLVRIDDDDPVRRLER